MSRLFYEKKLTSGISQEWPVSGTGVVRTRSAEGFLMGETNYVDGKKEGICCTYFLSGVLRLESHYHNDTPHGKWHSFSEDRDLLSNVNYHEGHLHGDCIFYYPNGSLRRISHYHMGVKDGMERQWSKRGVLMVERIYEEGSLVINRSWEVHGGLAFEECIHPKTAGFRVKHWNQSGELIHLSHKLPSGELVNQDWSEENLTTETHTMPD